MACCLHGLFVLPLIEKSEKALFWEIVQVKQIFSQWPFTPVEVKISFIS